MGANPVWLPCSKQGQLQQAAHSHVHLGSEQLQGWWLPNFHGDTVLSLTWLTVKRVFPFFKWNFPYFNLGPLPLSSFHRAPLRSIWLHLLYFIGSSWAFSSPGCAITALSLSPHVSHHNPLMIFMAFQWIYSSMPMPWGAQDRTALQECLSCAETRAIITSLHLLAQVCLMQPRMLLAFFVTSMHCRLLFNLLPIRTWFSCLEIVSRVIWYTCRMKEKVWNNSGGDNMTLKTSV